MDLDDPANGPAGMIRHILAQLVLSHSAFDMTSIKQLLAIEPSQVGELCDVFADLIEQLPRRYLVLCILDGITLYEKSPNRCEAGVEAMRILLEVVDSCKRKGCLFKLLVTCPGSSRALYRQFDEEEIIWMPKKIEPHGGLTEGNWDASAGILVKDWLEDSFTE